MVCHDSSHKALQRKFCIHLYEILANLTTYKTIHLHLKMEAMRRSETLLTTHQTTRRHNPDDDSSHYSLFHAQIRFTFSYLCNILGTESFMRSSESLSLSRNSPPSMRSEGSLRCPQSPPLDPILNQMNEVHTLTISSYCLTFYSLCLLDSFLILLVCFIIFREFFI